MCGSSQGLLETTNEHVVDLKRRWRGVPYISLFEFEFERNILAVTGDGFLDDLATDPGFS